MQLQPSKSQKQGTVSRNSSEAGFKRISIIIVEIVWLKGLFKELETEVKMRVKLFCDSKVAIQIATHPIFYERIKYFYIDYHFVRKKIMDGLIQTHHIWTREQQVNLLTKGLCKP